MRIARIAVVGGMTLALVAAWALGTAAQDAEVPPDPMAAAYFTGTLHFDGTNLAPGTSVVVDGVEQSRDQAWGDLTFEASDPRISGKLTVTFSSDWYPLPDGDHTGVAWGTYRIENAQGAWAGSFTGADYPDDRSPDFVRLEGEGAYEGLSALVHESSGPIEGVIVPGALPPVE